MVLILSGGRQDLRPVQVQIGTMDLWSFFYFMTVESNDIPAILLVSRLETGTLKMGTRGQRPGEIFHYDRGRLAQY
jgi:hypothetical protein